MFALFSSWISWAFIQLSVWSSCHLFPWPGGTHGSPFQYGRAHQRLGSFVILILSQGWFPWFSYSVTLGKCMKMEKGSNKQHVVVVVVAVAATAAAIISFHASSCSMTFEELLTLANNGDLEAPVASTVDSTPHHPIKTVAHPHGLQQFLMTFDQLHATLELHKMRLEHICVRSALLWRWLSHCAAGIPREHSRQGERWCHCSDHVQWYLNL